MKKILFPIFIIVYSVQILSFSQESEVFSKVKERLHGITRSEKFYSGREYYHYSYKTDQPRYSKDYQENPSWKNDEIMFFANKEGAVSQLALISHQCGIPSNAQTFKSVRTQMQALLDREVPLIFVTKGGNKLSLSDQEISSLGEDFGKTQKISLKAKIPGVKRIRLTRGFYKCDGKGGHGLRVDFFL